MFECVPLPLQLQLVDEMLRAYEIAREFNTNVEQVIGGKVRHFAYEQNNPILAQHPHKSDFSTQKQAKSAKARDARDALRPQSPLPHVRRIKAAQRAIRSTPKSPNEVRIVREGR